MAALSHIAEGQERLISALTGPDGSGMVDAEQRMRLRSIDVQLLKILEEMIDQNGRSSRSSLSDPPPVAVPEDAAAVCRCG